MMTKLILACVLLLLTWGFWVSATFKEISAGVAIFLFGMICMERGFKSFSGGLLERTLGFSTDRHWKSLLFGAVTTTFMQSSSLVSVMTISFISAGLIGLAGGIGIIFGANLGTTTGAWLVAGFGLKVSLSAYALPMLVFGVLLLFQRGRTLPGLGQILLGFGFLFLGIDYMKSGFEGFSTTLDLTQWSMSGWQGLLLYTAFGILATVVMQSSHATLVIIITALGAGQVSYENALALAVGSNVGTTITAILGALSAPVAGKRLAAAHLLFNVFTGLLALAFMAQLVIGVSWISALLGIAADNYTLQLAVFHTLFNLAGVVLFLPAIDILARALEKGLPDQPGATQSRPKHLNTAAASIPELALRTLTLETQHLFQETCRLMNRALSLSAVMNSANHDFDRFLPEPFEVEVLDFDQVYLQRIKPLFTANLNFYSRAAEKTGPEDLARLQSVWQANVAFVAALKAAKHLRKNLQANAPGRHPASLREYNRLRFRVAYLLSELSEVGESLSDPALVMTLDDLQLEQSDAARFALQRVDTLIRSHELVPEKAASLMNDLNYVGEIEQQLLMGAEKLLASADSGGVDLRLGEDRLQEIQQDPEHTT